VGVKFIVGDSSSVVAAGLGSILGPGFELTFAVRSFAQLLEAARDLAPDVVVLDPDALAVNLNRLEELRRQTAAGIVLFHDPGSRLAASLRQSGGWFCVAKTAEAGQIGSVIREAAAGRTGRLPQQEQESLARLSTRQMEILGLVAMGRTSKEIANILGISNRTVDFHRAHIVSRLGLRHVADWTRFALEAGLLQGSAPRARGR
jgi:two-component system NarL family response regulator